MDGTPSHDTINSQPSELLGVGSDTTDTCVGVHGPYTTILHLPFYRRETPTTASFCWYKFDDVNGIVAQDTSFRYDFLAPRNTGFPSFSGANVGFAYRMDPEDGVLYVASVALTGRTISLTRIGTGPSFQKKTQTFQTSLQWTDRGFHGIRIVNDFLYCCTYPRAEQQVIELIHIPTEKRLRALLRSKRSLSGQTENYKIEFAITSCHFIHVLDSNAIEVFDLPDLSQWIPNSPESGNRMVPVELRPVFSDSLPRQFTDIYVLPSPAPSSLVIVAAGDPDGMKRGADYQVSLMSLDMIRHKIREVKEMSMKGTGSRTDRRLTLTYTPATHRAAGIVVTRTKGTRHRVGPANKHSHQKLKYIQVSVDSEPTMTLNELDISSKVIQQLGHYHYIDIFVGRLIWQSEHKLRSRDGFGVLTYL